MNIGRLPTKIMNKKIDVSKNRERNNLHFLQLLPRQLWQVTYNYKSLKFQVAITSPWNYKLHLQILEVTITSPCSYKLQLQVLEITTYDYKLQLQVLEVTSCNYKSLNLIYFFRQITIAISFLFIMYSFCLPWIFFPIGSLKKTDSMVTGI
jgi:hypothetical protein